MENKKSGAALGNDRKANDAEMTAVNIETTQRLQATIGQYVMSIATLESRISVLTAKINRLEGSI